MSNVTAINFDLPVAAPGSLDVQWIHESVSAKHNTAPDIQVHAYNEHTLYPAAKYGGACGSAVYVFARWQ